jgi:hypothetical protein
MSYDLNDYDRKFGQYLAEGWLPVMDTRPYTCGFCGRAVTSSVGFQREESTITVDRTQERDTEIRVCPLCWGATTFGRNSQYPRPTQGDSFTTRDKQPDVKQIVALYNEARSALAENAPSCAVLMFRKLLMHIAVQQGASAGLRFIQYVEYLKNEAVVGKPMHPLIERIRREGNEENHEIVRATPEKTQDLLTLVTFLIRSVYFMD